MPLSSRRFQISTCAHTPWTSYDNSAGLTESDLRDIQGLLGQDLPCRDNVVEMQSDFARRFATSLRKQKCKLDVDASMNEVGGRAVEA